MKTFTIYTDNAHGWLAVTFADLADVNLSPLDFSRFSYHRGETLYLEEDCDASKFLAAYQAKHGGMPIIRESYSQSRSRIRSYARVRT